MPAIRVIDDPAGPGAWNMALDEALLECLASGASGPALRFYGWSPPALSLGYSQSAEDVDFEACERLGVDVVRRPTGGRAVLHVAELTYSITAPAGSESVAASYCRISRAIGRAIARLGVSASVEPGTSKARSADCFAVSTAADLVVDGRKIVGSAQVRRRGFLLQHGSIKLEPASLQVSQVLRLSGATSRLATLSDFLGQPAASFLAHLKRAIAEELGARWQPEAPRKTELELARAIAARSSSLLRQPGQRHPAAG